MNLNMLEDILINTLLEGLFLSVSGGVRSLSPTSDNLSLSSKGSGGAIAASEIPDLVVNTTLAVNTLLQVLHELREPVDLFPEEVAQFLGSLMRAMHIITSTSLVAECVSWNGTGEVRESLALSCWSLLSSICPEGALSMSSSSGANPDVALDLTGGPSRTLFTSDGSNRGTSPAPEVTSGASQPLTPMQARWARCKKLAEACAWSQLSSNN